MYTKKQIDNLNNDIKSHFKHLFPITEDMKLSFDGVSRMVMLDRYSQKDQELKTLGVGDVVLTIVKNDPSFPTRGIGSVIEIRGQKAVISIEEQYAALVSDEFKIDKNVNNIIIKEISTLSKPLELFFEQIATRIGNALGQDEADSVKQQFVDELKNLNFIPAGRVLYGAGSGKEVTFFNCYVMPYIKDSREGIANHREKVAEIMSRGGGVGTNGSTLRPKGDAALGVGGTSSGAVSWLNDLSQLTHLIEQGGSRRGAQMIMMADWHPDIVEFIISKMQNIHNLKFIKNNFKSEIIKSEVNNKMILKSFDPTTKALYNNILSNKGMFDASLVGDIEKKITNGGEWEIVNPSFLTGANISVAISNRFMEAVEKDLDWDLRFPDIKAMTKEQKEFYNNEWHNIGDVFEWEALGYPVKTFRTIRAKELWMLINSCATYSAEPGIFFLDKANEMTNAKGYGQKVVCTNPCGEQPLAPYSVCNLGAINLSNFVDKKTKEVLFDKLKTTVTACVRLQDNIIDITPYFLEENKQQALGERRVGLGVMGLHDMLIWAGIRYGSPESIKLIDKVFETITVTAYETSIQLAKEKGSFPFLTDRDKFVKSGFLKTMPKEIIDGIKEYGIRNSHLITVAPTGSTGTMVGCSTGLEPYFAFSYFRSGRLGKFIEVKSPIVEEWLNYYPEFKNKQLPELFVSAMELTPIEHADVQCVIQRWVDSSISKTVNAPRGYKVKQVEEIYSYLYNHGAKGGTVYVDGSRDSQILSLEKEENLFEEEFIKTGAGAAKATDEEIISKLNDENTILDNTVRKIGSDVGDTCFMCEIGTFIESAGCVTCSNCGLQTKCGL